MQQSSSAEYLSNAKAIIDKVLDKKNKDEVVYINNFNYTDLSAISDSVWFINGDTSNPIFGVDLPESKPDDKKYVYTKTYRRLELTGNKSYYPKTKDFSKVIVLGHSLNEQDYSYFFSLFNRLGLSNERNSGKKGYTVEFVYYKHNNKSSFEVRKETVSRALKMFYEYNKQVLHEDNFRLMDILYSSKAITFKEIEI